MIVQSIKMEPCHLSLFKFAAGLNAKSILRILIIQDFLLFLKVKNIIRLTELCYHITIPSHKIKSRNIVRPHQTFFQSSKIPTNYELKHVFIIDSNLQNHKFIAT